MNYIKKSLFYKSYDMYRTFFGKQLPESVLLFVEKKVIIDDKNSFLQHFILEPFLFDR